MDRFPERADEVDIKTAEGSARVRFFEHTELLTDLASLEGAFTALTRDGRLVFRCDDGEEILVEPRRILRVWMD